MRKMLSLSVVFASACQPATSGSAVTPDDGALPLPPASTIVSLTFDDTLADQFQVGAAVAARQLRATFYVNSPRIGNAGFMTLDQLRELEAGGNEIAGHTLTHPYLTQLTVDQARHEICDDRAALVNLGFSPAAFAYPFGDENAAVRHIVVDCGYTSGRSVGGLVTGAECTSCPVANAIPPVDAELLKTNGSVNVGTTLDMLKTFVEQSEAKGGGWVPIVFHHVCVACNPNSISPDDFGAFLDWLAQRRQLGTEVRTVTGVLDHGA